MKKLLSTLALALLLTACNTKWDHADPNMPADLVTYNQTILDEQLAILEEDPENTDALFEVAFRYQQLGSWKEAVSYYEKVLEQSENDYATLNNLAYIYEQMEDYNTSANYIKRLYAANQSDIETIKDTVRILLKSGDALNAEHAVQNFASLSLDPLNTDPDMQALVDELYQDIYDWAAEHGQSVEDLKSTKE